VTLLKGVPRCTRPHAKLPKPATISEHAIAPLQHGRIVALYSKEQLKLAPRLGLAN
jgi:hypothetical protein